MVHRVSVNVFICSVSTREGTGEEEDRWISLKTVSLKEHREDSEAGS